jgi:8-oxo-dGTP pyrophosphatase MutT (NUDIX family)
MSFVIQNDHYIGGGVGGSGPRFKFPRRKQEGAGIIILDPSMQYILLVSDSRHGKYSIPKGQREAYDISPFANAARETFEETGYVLGRDYSNIYFEFVLRNYSIFTARSFSFYRYFLYNYHEYIASVEWVHISQLHKYPLNWLSRTALKMCRLY